ncbi:MAG: hypothetical protein HOD37_20510 [Bacteroidetes bacterium]|nr:hypothetical protein [Bacteroidota bacterium]
MNKIYIPLILSGVLLLSFSCKNPENQSSSLQMIDTLSEVNWKNAKWIGYESWPDSLKITPGVHGFGNQLGN